MAVNETTSVDVQTLRPFKRFIMTIGLLPTSYLESMTYAELVMWFCNFLQEQVIPTVNNNAEAVIELQNWFNNLDVQDEIDNKLDEMVEEGTLQEIIADYLNSKAVFGFDTLANMKSATNLIDGSYAQTLGYHSKDDEGAGLYKIREITNDDVVDEAFIVALDSNDLIAELILKDSVNPEVCGAYGDDTHDDILAIQKMINYVKDHNQYKIIMNKQYQISDTIDISLNHGNIEINGKITYTGASYAVRYNGDHGRLYIDNLVSNYDGVLIEGTSTQSSAYNEFNFNYMACQHDGIVEYANNGWLQYNEFRFKNIRANNIGINLITQNNASTSWITETKYWGGHISAISYPGYNEYCIYMNGQSAKCISTQKFYNIGFEGTKIGCHLENADACVFDHFRNRESIQTRLFELVGKCSRNEFMGEGIYMKWIKWDGLTSFSYPNTFRGTFLTDGGTVYNFTEFSVDHAGMKWCNQNTYTYVNYGDGGYALGLDTTKSWYGFPREILMGNNADLILDTKYYNYQNINTLYLIMSSSTSNAIKDQNGNTLRDLTGLGLGYKKVKVTFVQTAHSSFAPNGILLEEVTPL